LTALLAGKGIDHQVRGTHHALLNRRCSLQCQQLSEQGLVEPTAELGQQLGQHEVLLGAIYLHLGDPAGIHHREVGAQLATDLFIGTMQFMFE
jgi:hypothetical protein